MLLNHQAKMGSFYWPACLNLLIKENVGCRYLMGGMRAMPEAQRIYWSSS